MNLMTSMLVDLGDQVWDAVEEQVADAKLVHLVVTGSLAYGWFNTGSSDIDFRGIYLPPVERMLDPWHGRLPVVRGSFEDTGVVVDYEVRSLLDASRLVLKGNGNMLDELGSLSYAFSGLIPSYQREWGEHLTVMLSTQYLGHYFGLANAEYQRFKKEHSAKQALYALRSLMAGMVLADHGKVVVNIRDLATYFDYIDPLTIEFIIKQRDAGGSLSGYLLEQTIELFGQLNVDAAGKGRSDWAIPATPDPMAVDRFRSWVIETQMETRGVLNVYD